jgi:hypothetical protein
MAGRLSIGARLVWIGNRRGAQADRRRWFLMLEGDLEFALRLREIRRRGCNPRRGVLRVRRPSGA